MDIQAHLHCPWGMAPNTKEDINVWASLADKIGTLASILSDMTSEIWETCPVLTSVNKLFSLWTIVWENRVISKEQRIPWPWPATSAAQPWSHPSTPAVTSRIASPARSHLASQPRHEPSWRRCYNSLTARFTPTSTQPTPHWNCWTASAAAQCLAPA